MRRKIINNSVSASTAVKRQFAEIDPIIITEEIGPEPKRPMTVEPRPVQRSVAAPKQTVLPNLIVITQEAPPAPKVTRSESNVVTPNKPRILNQASKVLNVSSKEFKSPDLKTKEDGGIELILQNDELSPGASSGLFPCNECNRTFLLKQMLDLHMTRHKKERSDECDYCNKKFFSKYDLAKHVLTHSEEKPFKCTVCDKGFTRSNLLSRHEKQHTDQLHFECSFCDKTFLNASELEKHEFNHRKNRPFKCEYCDKSFAFKQGLERHEVKHMADQPFKCEYCNSGFSTATKLARHLTEHAGRRPYPCRLCANSYLLSHHLARHLRSHKNVKSTFICNNCPQTFNTLNELIAHSENHVEDEYICPLCREEMAGPEEMSDHIELHAGEQFACEFCDLIFVEEERKDDHCDREHAAEQAEYDQDMRTRKVESKVSEGNEETIEEVEISEVNNDIDMIEAEPQEVLDTKPRRGRPPKATILNYSKTIPTSDSPPKQAPNKKLTINDMDNNDDVDDDDNLMNFEFNYVDIKEIKTTKSPPTMTKKPTVQPKKELLSPASNASNQRKISVSPTKKLSPSKHVPIAQQKLEQQLQNAMKSTHPAQVKISNDSPNVKNLPSGVTLKKVVARSRPPTAQPTEAPSPRTSSASSQVSGQKRPTPAKPAANNNQNTYGKKDSLATSSPAPKPLVQRVKMTQAQVDAMAKEGKIQMKNGQVFLRNTKSS